MSFSQQVLAREQIMNRAARLNSRPASPHLASSRALKVSNAVSNETSSTDSRISIKRWNTDLHVTDARETARVQMPAREPKTSGSNQIVDGTEVHILILNSSTAMAKEMSLLLTEAIPGCSLTFAPSVELALWIISRKRINLVVSDPVPAGGGLARLQTQLARMNEPPDLVIVGDRRSTQQLESAAARYQLVTQRKTDLPQELPRIIRRTPSVVPVHTPRDQNIQQQGVRQLGADLRNDMNNPLQEIVTMLFVAKNTGELTPATSSALSAIEGAAKTLASVVSGLEARISSAVNR